MKLTLFILQTTTEERSADYIALYIPLMKHFDAMMRDVGARNWAKMGIQHAIGICKYVSLSVFCRISKLFIQFFSQVA